MSSNIIEELDNKLIPSLLTTSARAVTEYYGERIVELEALGGRTGQNKRWLDEDYGMYIDEPGQAMLRWEYEQRRDTDGNILNPLDEAALEDRLQSIDEELPAYEDDAGDRHPPDLTVDKVVIEVTDEDLTNATTATTETFELTFESDPVENGSGDATKGKQANKGVYKQGFKLRNLNLHRMVEVSNMLSDEKTQELVSWNGPHHISPRCPRLVTANICEKYIPDEFIGLKVFEVTEEENLKLRALVQSADEAAAVARGDA